MCVCVGGGNLINARIHTWHIRCYNASSIKAHFKNTSSFFYSRKHKVHCENSSNSSSMGDDGASLEKDPRSYSHPPFFTDPRSTQRSRIWSRELAIAILGRRRSHFGGTRGEALVSYNVYNRALDFFPLLPDSQRETLKKISPLSLSSLPHFPSRIFYNFYPKITVLKRVWSTSTRGSESKLRNVGQYEMLPLYSLFGYVLIMTKINNKKSKFEK